jgi:hypothetical protein
MAKLGKIRKIGKLGKLAKVGKTAAGDNKSPVENKVTETKEEVKEDEKEND